MGFTLRTRDGRLLTRPITHPATDAQVRAQLLALDQAGQLSSRTALDSFLDNVDVDYAYDAATGANYTVIRVYKTRLDGTEQHPFVYAPGGTGPGAQSTLEMTTQRGWLLAINAGIFHMDSCRPDGLLIQSGTVLQDGPSAVHSLCMPLTIDQHGDLSYASATADGAALVQAGIVSAVCGFMPIVVDYEAVPSAQWNSVAHYTQNAQRQIIGQFGNGDYAIVTCEGRSYQHSDGWTIAEAQDVCLRLGLRFAYNLDGGGSAQTMLGRKHINSIYERASGRIVPTFIVFNGTSSFGATA